MSNEPHALAVHLALRCGARTRRGTRCQAPAMRGKKRCRLHGGKSTGPRTPEGLERSRKARWKHGLRSAQAIAQRRSAMTACRLLRRLIAEM
jgi:hypothetical protein